MGLLVKTAGTASTNSILQLESGGTEKFIVRSDGNVGIGTTAPFTTFHVNAAVGTPASSGNINTGVAISNGATGPSLNMGNYNVGSTYYSWIQSAFINNASVTEPLVLQQIGGNVGIGTTAPSAPLHVRYSSANTAATTPALVIDNPSSGGQTALSLRINNTAESNIRADSYGNLVLSAGGSSATVYIGYTDLGSVGAINMNNGQVYITNGGNVGIGTTGPSYILDVSGQARFTGGYTTSDRRWKTDIKPIEDALSVVTHLQGVTFDWRRKEFPAMHFAEGKQIGFIAQDVEKVLPEIVSTDKDGFKNLSYESITPMLVEAVKRLKADNDNEEAHIKSLTARLDALEAARMDHSH